MNRRSKRIVDIALAAVGLLVLAPVIALIALAVRIDLGSPVLFRQSRPGLHESPFEMIKFRTMHEPPPGMTASVSDLEHRIQDRARISTLGRFLRQTSLDELPELWNVLKGDMSIVGPRPLLMEYLPLYTAEQTRRHEVRPGITGLAQIRGRHVLEWSERFKLDLWYIDHWSMRLDLEIIGATASTVVRRSGQPPKDTPDNIFMGSATTTDASAGTGDRRVG